MRLQQWAANGWLRPHQTTPAQIADLFAIVDRDIEDSMRDLSAARIRDFYFLPSHLIEPVSLVDLMPNP